MIKIFKEVGEVVDAMRVREDSLEVIEVELALFEGARIPDKVEVHVGGYIYLLKVAGNPQGHVKGGEGDKYNGKRLVERRPGEEHTKQNANGGEEGAIVIHSEDVVLRPSPNIEHASESQGKLPEKGEGECPLNSLAIPRGEWDRREAESERVKLASSGSSWNEKLCKCQLR